MKNRRKMTLSAILLYTIAKTAAGAFIAMLIVGMYDWYQHSQFYFDLYSWLILFLVLLAITIPVKLWQTIRTG